MRPAPLHLIATISYQLDIITCTCGETTTAALGVGWFEHRKASGLQPKNVGSGFRRTKPKDGSWSIK